MPLDETDRRVKETIINAAARAYGFQRHDDYDDPGADDDYGCSECGTEWRQTMQPCPGCGITIETLAERILARIEQANRR